MRWQAVAAAAAVLMPALAVAQQDTMRVRQDTARGAIESPARPGSARARNLGLTTEQAQELQQALQSNGCDPGPIDGIVGPRTREAMTCARRQLNVAGTGTQANQQLFSALNLSFGTQTGAAAGAVQRDTTAAQRDTTAMQRTDTAAVRDTTRMRDTTARDTTARDTTRGRPPTSSDTTRRPPR